MVTSADLALERMLSAALASERPNDAVLGEELGGASVAPRRWILDPIDGTRNFVAGRPDWGVHIALEHGLDGDPLKDRLRALPGWIEPVDLDAIMRVAEGDLEAFVDGTQSQIWDRAPHVVLVEEAGGRYQDRAGGKDLELPGALLTNGHIEAELDELLGRASPVHTRAWNSIT